MNSTAAVAAFSGTGRVLLGQVVAVLEALPSNGQPLFTYVLRALACLSACLPPASAANRSALWGGSVLEGWWGVSRPGG